MLKPISIGEEHILAYPVRAGLDFQPGMIAQLNVVEDAVVLDIGDGACPFGLFYDYPKPEHDQQVIIQIGRRVWRTDQHNPDQHYLVNQVLFAGTDGRLTNIQPTPNHPGIAIVLRPPHDLGGDEIEFMWM